MKVRAELLDNVANTVNYALNEAGNGQGCAARAHGLLERYRAGDFSAYILMSRGVREREEHLLMFQFDVGAVDREQICKRGVLIVKVLDMGYNAL